MSSLSGFRLKYNFRDCMSLYLHILYAPTKLKRRIPGMEVIMFGGGLGLECDFGGIFFPFIHTHVPMKPLKYADISTAINDMFSL